MPTIDDSVEAMRVLDAMLAGIARHSQRLRFRAD
jgi:hypothetical protein